MRPDLNTYYLNVALAVSDRSTCLRKHYGAVLVSANNAIVATGYNGVPTGESHCEACSKVSHAKDESAYLSCRSVHAEMNCLLSASKSDMQGGVLYLAGYDCITNKEMSAPYPCEICTRLLKNSGVARVVTRAGTIFIRNSDGALLACSTDNAVSGGSISD